ncbi:MAG TPA: hypothetical protein VE861_12950, partial [Gemmatimonadaceae bacterium]|nr:hypothetical protein [Gemmatimonadaceae bacterium]
TAAARWIASVRDACDNDGGGRDSWQQPDSPAHEFKAAVHGLDRAYRSAKSDKRRRERARIGFAMVEAERAETMDAEFAAALCEVGGPLVAWRLADRCTEGLGMMNRPLRSIELDEATWQVIADCAMTKLLEGETQGRAAGSATMLALTAAGALMEQWATWRASALASLIMSGADDDCRDALLLLLAGGLSVNGVATSELQVIAETAPIYGDAEVQPFVANHPAATAEVHHALGLAFVRAAHRKTPRGGAAAFAARCRRILGPDHPVTAAGLAAWPATRST